MCLGLDPAALDGLERGDVSGVIGGRRYRASLGIRDYDAGVERHYGQRVAGLDMNGRFRHFGLVFELEEPTELALHDSARRLDEGLASLVTRYGPVLFRNAYMDDAARGQCQHNVFKSLNFHLDRGSTQSDHYSLFWRDPFDPKTRMPRTSTTLVLSNAAAYLQALSEGAEPHAFRQRYDLFQPRVPDGLIGDLLFELPWSAPEGQGEIAVLDNRTVLHASYYKKAQDRGYPIAVRYLY